MRACGFVVHSLKGDAIRKGEGVENMRIAGSGGHERIPSLNSFSPCLLL
jgi:hypothetical protein